MVDQFEKLLTTFKRHLKIEPNLSVHTIRAYMGDLISLLEDLSALGITDLSTLELAHIWSWLANQNVKGASHTA